MAEHWCPVSLSGLTKGDVQEDDTVSVENDDMESFSSLVESFKHGVQFVSESLR